MDQVQEHELRRWADGLCASADRERRAMGKAILMLLQQIETLRGELEKAQRPTGNDAASAVPEGGGVPAGTSADGGEDTATISLRERLLTGGFRGHS